MAIFLKKLIVAVFGALACLAAAGCAGGLEGTQWKLVQWPATSISPAKFAITAKFDTGGVRGFSGINTYRGPCVLGEDGSFSVWPLEVTTKIGSSELQNAESVYLSNLEHAHFFNVVDGRLVLLDQDKKALLVYEQAGK